MPKSTVKPGLTASPRCSVDGRAGAGRPIDLRARVVAAIDAAQTEEHPAIRFGCWCTRWGRYPARRPPTGSVAPMHAWLPASMAVADVTVAKAPG
jgi:hypothetical protein